MLFRSAPIGRKAPVSPWGQPALGYKTRNKKAKSDKLIVRRRNDKYFSRLVK